MIKFLQGKSAQERNRIAVIATGCIAFVLVAVMIYTYTLPPQPERGPEVAITTAYATLLEKIQSLFRAK